MEYNKYIETKKILNTDSGIIIKPNELNKKLFDFQKDIVIWALKKGKAALFTMTGTGKTFMQLEWARKINEHTDKKILIVAPLAVNRQTQREANKLDIEITLCKESEDIKNGINITNYERLDKFNLNDFIGIVLDESSILKSFTGKIRNKIIQETINIPYRLACTATPAPNDFMELGNHAEFLGVMKYNEMLAMFFINDANHTGTWRLKGHAEKKYWEWLSSWAVVLTKPSDLGYEDGDFRLKPLHVYESIVKHDKPMEGFLFPMNAQTLQERQQARRESTIGRAKRCAEIVNRNGGAFIIWCNLNYESDVLAKMIPDAIEIRGAHKDEYKEKSMLDFSDGKIRVLVTKPTIAGFGMNWQHCNNVIFVGLSDSFEQYFQAVRRCWRFGQKNPVDVHIITSELEGAVVENIKRKERDSLKMINEMVKHTKKIVSQNIKQIRKDKKEYNPSINIIIPEWIK